MSESKTFAEIQSTQSFQDFVDSATHSAKYLATKKTIFRDNGGNRLGISDYMVQQMISEGLTKGAHLVGTGVSPFERQLWCQEAAACFILAAAIAESLRQDPVK